MWFLENLETLIAKATQPKHQVIKYNLDSHSDTCTCSDYMYLNENYVIGIIYVCIIMMHKLIAIIMYVKIRLRKLKL